MNLQENFRKKEYSWAKFAEDVVPVKISIPLIFAYYCPNCNSIFNRDEFKDRCPTCTSKSAVSLVNLIWSIIK